VEVYTIPEYCAAEKTSRAKVYEEWKRGEGVEFFRRGARILISHEARVRYRERLERQAREAREIAPEASAPASSDDDPVAQIKELCRGRLSEPDLQRIEVLAAQIRKPVQAPAAEGERQATPRETV